MLKFNVEDRVGTIVIERALAGNAVTEEMVRELGGIIRRAAEEADIVALSGAGPDFTIGRDRHEPKSGSPFDVFRKHQRAEYSDCGIPRRADYRR